MRVSLGRLICLVVLVAGCVPGPSSGQTQPPAGSGSPTSAPSATTNGQPTPARTVGSEPTDEPDLYIGGTITWTAQTSMPVADTIIHTQSVSGTAFVVIHVVIPSLLLAERDTGNTYSYDYSNNYSCPSSHEEGTLESQVGVGTEEEWDYSIATLNPGGTLGEDLHLQIAMPDYCGPTMGGDVDRSRPGFSGFPDCEPLGDQLYARFDGVENYVIDCDVIGLGAVTRDVGTVSGHVSGTLSPLGGPHL